MQLFYKINDISLSKKMAVGFFVVICFTVLIGIYSTITIAKMSQETEDMYQFPYSATETILNIKNDILKIQSGMQDISTAKSSEAIEEAAKNIVDYENTVFQNLKIFQTCYSGDKENIRAFKQLFIDWNPVRDEVVRLSLAGMSDVANQITIEKSTIRVAALNKMIDELIIETNGDAQDFVAQSKTTSFWAMVTNVVFILIIAVISLFIAILTTRSISRPLGTLQESVQYISTGHLDVNFEDYGKNEIGALTRDLRTTTIILNEYISEISYILTQIAKGDLTVSVAGDYKGDFIAIKESLDTISQSLNGTMYQISHCAEAVNGSSNKVYDIASDLSGGMKEQLSALERLDDSVKAVFANTQENAEHADQANHLALEIKQYAIDSNERMADLQQSMGALEQSSGEIAKIVTLIDGLASQIRLLALNASIEAARAGKYGKGFAVVAEEFGLLAIKSAEAAKETQNKIEQTIVKIGEGAQAADETTDNLQTILQGIQNMAEKIDYIALASNKQTARITDISTEVMTISTVAGHTAETAEQSIKESKLLEEQAEEFNRLIDRFRLKTHQTEEETTDSIV